MASLACWLWNDTVGAHEYKTVKKKKKIRLNSYLSQTTGPVPFKPQIFAKLK